MREPARHHHQPPHGAKDSGVTDRLREVRGQRDPVPLRAQRPERVPARRKGLQGKQNNPLTWRALALAHTAADARAVAAVQTYSRCQQGVRQRVHEGIAHSRACTGSASIESSAQRSRSAGASGRGSPPNTSARSAWWAGLAAAVSVRATCSEGARVGASRSCAPHGCRVRGRVAVPPACQGAHAPRQPWPPAAS